MYKTPKACYEKAPVRRETLIERAYRLRDQISTEPETREYMDTCGQSFTINRDLVPGEAKYIKEVSNV